MTASELNEIMTGLTPEQREQFARAFGVEVVAWLNKNVPDWRTQIEKEKRTEAAITSPPRDSRLFFYIGVVAMLVVALVAILSRK